MDHWAIPNQRECVPSILSSPDIQFIVTRRDDANIVRHSKLATKPPAQSTSVLRSLLNTLPLLPNNFPWSIVTETATKRWIRSGARGQSQSITRPSYLTHRANTFCTICCHTFQIWKIQCSNFGRQPLELIVVSITSAADQRVQGPNHCLTNSP